MLFRSVVAVPLLQFLHFRLKPLHACHALLLIDGQRKHEQSGENGKRNDRYTEISENVVEKHQHIAENFADKVKKCIHFLINFPLLLNFQFWKYFKARLIDSLIVFNIQFYL